MSPRSWVRRLYTRAKHTPACQAWASLQSLESRVTPNTYTVTTTTDTGAGSGLTGDLRYCVNQANANPGADTIAFAFGSPTTITLGGAELALTDKGGVTINGPAPGVTVNANKQSRVFNVASGAVANIVGLTITGGSATFGGGVFSLGTVTLTNSTVSGNSAKFGGGGIYNYSGGLTLTNSTVSGNSVKNGGVLNGQGGGIYNVSGAVTLTNSTVSGNSAFNAGGITNTGAMTLTNTSVSANASSVGGGFAGFAGGILNGSGGVLTLIGSTVSGNSADGGGGMFCDGTVTLTNSTVSGNSAGNKGGGIYTAGALTLTSSTVSGNSANVGGGIWNTGSLTLTNSIAAGNTAPFNSDILGSFTQTNSLVDMSAAAAGLGTLGNYGGPTKSIPLLPGSPAIGTGGATTLTFDQRGAPFARTTNGKVDIGAIQSQQTFVVDENSDVVDGNFGVGKLSLREAVNLANLNPGSDIITVAFGSATTITLGGAELALTDKAGVTINGTASGVTVNANKQSRVFNVAANAVASITGLTIMGGSVSGFGTGGGILNSGTLSVANSTVSGNSAQFAGGIYNDGGSLTLTNSTVSGNTAGASGGGIYTVIGSLTLINSTISGNSAGNRGAGIYHDFGGLVTLTNSTVSGNTSGVAGAGITSFGGGIVALTNSIVAGNTAPSNSDIFGSFTQANSLVNMSAAAAGLGTLGNYGGPTKTIPLLPGSPAIGTGGATTLTFDQRGAPFARTTNGKVDIGAIQSQQTLVVDENSDADDGNYAAGKLNLREAIKLANLNPGPDTITFNLPAASTITLGGTELVITDSLTVAGPAGGVTVSGGNSSRVFTLAVPGAGAVALSDLAVTNGKANGPGGINAGDDNLTLTRCTISNNVNTGVFNAGGIGGGGTWNFVDSTFSGNSGSFGGAAYMFGTGSLTMSGCTVSGNTASANGGGLYFVNASTTIINSTISGNTAQTSQGGGLFSFGPSPFSAGVLTIRNSTITGNSAPGGGGGICHFYGGAITVDSTIVAGNLASGAAATADFTSELAPLLVNGNANLVGVMDPANNTTLSGTGNLTGTKAAPLDAKLAPLADNGGPTKTHGLLTGSPAINTGSNPAALLLDQRGRTRTVNGIDIGAFELQPARVTLVEVNGGAAQRSMVTQLKVTFDSPVFFVGPPAAAFTLTRQNDSALVTLNAALDPSRLFVTLTFAGGAVDGVSLADGRYTLNALAAQFAADGLDGDGNGVGGDNYTLVGSTAAAPKLFRLFGDVDGDGFTDLVDLLAFRTANGSQTGDANFNAAFDFNGDGNVDLSDFIAFRQRLGVTP